MVLGRGERSKAKRVSEHLESADTGEGSAGLPRLVGTSIQGIGGDKQIVGGTFTKKTHL